METIKDNSIIDAMTSKAKDVVISLLGHDSAFAGKQLKTLRFVRVRENRFIWELQLSSASTPPVKVFIKAFSPRRDNIFEIILYKKNPASLRIFFPDIYYIGKKYGYYWLMMEELKTIPVPTLCKPDFEERIKLMASLHAKNYNEHLILTNKELDWVPNFRKDWNKRMNRLWLFLQLNKYMRNPKTSDALAKDYALLKKTIYLSPSALKPLLKLPHTVIHGCLTPHHFLLSPDNSRLKLIDWATICFAPFTIDLVDLIERGIREYALEEIRSFDFRENCISFYLECLRKNKLDIKISDFKKWYEITLLFKIVGEIIWIELKKMSRGQDSKYYWYRDQLSELFNRNAKIPVMMRDLSNKKAAL